MSTAIRCTALKKRYPGRVPVEAVQGLDLSINVGECFGLLGPNGAGKTTTMEILAGLLEADSGEVEIFSLRWGHDDHAIRERIGVSLQETRLAEKLTVRETLQLFRSFYASGLTPDEAIARVSLEEKVRAYVGKLSGGQKQRLAVACALVGDPEVLFLDEPTTGLDPQSRRSLWDVIHGFRETNRTVLLTTHYMDEAERLCDRVAIIDHGKIIAIGSPRELIQRLGGDHIIEFELAANPDAMPGIEAFQQLPSVQAVHLAEGRYRLSIAEPHVALPALMQHLQQQRWELSSLTTRHATLEDVFVNLTGRHLRDEEAPKA